jgi:hypothetical protein
MSNVVRVVLRFRMQLWLTAVMSGAVVMLLLPIANASAHETRPAYLEINETSAGRYDVLWRTPVSSGMRLPVVLKFSEGTRDVTPPAVRELSDSLLERRIIEIPGGLAGAICPTGSALRNRHFGFVLVF